MASTSASVDASTASRSRWKSRSWATVRPYRPRYSEPSASIAPYGPIEAATNSACPGASTAARSASTIARAWEASPTLSRMSAVASSCAIPRRPNPSNVAWYEAVVATRDPAR